MEEKKSFGEYIRRKRLEAGLTQKELASRLYVTESTVSKWERALSYPDISMVPDICRELCISEHEFFTACDDDRARVQEREATHWRRTAQGVRFFFLVSYAVAIVVCFVCDLAVFRRLDWFWIVLTSVMLAFSFTSLPFLVERNRLPISLGAATGSLLLLLLSCWLYAGEWWIIGGMAITAACLILPWSWWAIWRFYGKHVPTLCMAAFSVWVFVLLAVIWAFTGGDWLVGFAYPIAAFCVGYCWLFFAAVRWLPLERWMKSAAVSFLTAFAVPLGNTLSAAMVPEQHTLVLTDYFAWWHIFTRENVNGFSWINVLVFWVMMAVSVVLLVIGAVTQARQREK